VNPNGAINIFNETLFGIGGKLYATFDTDIFDPSVPKITPVLNGTLYQIDPMTGVTQQVSSTASLITAVFASNGTTYAFLGDAFASAHVYTLDTTNGKTNFVADVDPAAGLVFGALVQFVAARGRRHVFSVRSPGVRDYWNFPGSKIPPSFKRGFPV
jgi:hypothetical protein